MVVKVDIKTRSNLCCHKSFLFILVLHSTTKDWTTLTNLYNLPFGTTSSITLFESKDFNQHLVASNSTLKPCYVNWLINNRFFANFGTYNISPIHKIPLGKLKTILLFLHTSNVLLSPRYTLWLKVYSSKVENTSFWKTKYCEVSKFINHASLQITKINKRFTRSLIFLVAATYEEPLNLLFQFCFFYSSNLVSLVTFFCKMAFGATIVASSFLLLLLIFELPPIYNPFELPKTPLVISVSCLVPWLNYTFQLHCNCSCNNYPHVKWKHKNMERWWQTP